MTVVVVRLGAPVHEILEVGDALIAIRISLRGGWTGREIVVEGGDARIDDRHTDAGTREAHQATYEKAATRDGRAEVVREDGTVVADANHVAVIRHAVQ